MAPGVDEIATPQAAKAHRIANFLPARNSSETPSLFATRTTTPLRFGSTPRPSLSEFSFPLPRGLITTSSTTATLGPAFWEPLGAQHFRCVLLHSASANFCGRAD